MSSITLTSSMRNNLLSLKNISTQMDKTQLILATGKKVNSAIDNASSYYQARSLTNRSADLLDLLNGMEQGIQTIEAANVGLEKASSLLEQMNSIVEQAGTIVTIPSKEEIAERLGANGAVVTTADELYDAINSGKETICVYGHIDLDNIDDADKEITLKAGQKLVGAEYFATGNTGGEKFSSITAEATLNSKKLIIITAGGCEVSDLAINYTNTYSGNSIWATAVYADGADASAKLNNLDIKFDLSASTSATGSGAITLVNGAKTDIGGKISLQNLGQVGSGIYTSGTGIITNINSGAKIQIFGTGIYTNANGAITNINSGVQINIQTSGTGISTNGNGVTTNINSGAQIKIQTTGTNGRGIVAGGSSTTNINSGAKIDITTSGSGGHGLVASGGGILNLNQGAEVKVKTLATDANGFRIETDGIANIAGNLYIEAQQSSGVWVFNGTNQLNILSSAAIYIEAGSNAISKYIAPNSILDIAQGAKIAIAKDGTTKWYEMQDKYHNESDWTSVNANNITTVLDVAETSAWTLPETIEIEEDNDNSANKQNIEAYQNQFNTALKEYDKLINDCGYQGINLLKGGNLKLTFDENRQHVFNILGQDISSNQLGINEALWQTQVDINNSIDEIKKSITTLRSLAENLGNQYGVIETRINFTEGLSDILQTGADDLTLADMNEASAQYLSLQTRQQLAINALSLAAQSASSVLSLF